MGKSNEFAIQIIVLLVLNVLFEVVTGYRVVGIKKNLDGVVDGSTTSNEL